MSSFGARRRARRDAARDRVRARVTEPMSASQRAFDPLGQDATIDGWSAAVLALLGALAIHGSVYGAGTLYAALGDDDEPDRAPTKIVVREQPPEPPPPPPEPEQIAAADVPEPTPVEPEPVKPPPEPQIKPKLDPPPEQPKPPPEAADKPPPRIVGLDLGATSEGGTGGSFGTGNTNDGKTDGTAADPKKVVRGGTGDGKEPTQGPPAKAEPPPNKAATKIPTAKAKMVLPKRRKPVTPPYPETLKSQGIEANVPVVVSIDETGKVTEVKIAKSSSYAEFDEAARKAALAELFEPATRDGVPVPATISYTYRFRLEDQ